MATTALDRSIVQFNPAAPTAMPSQGLIPVTLTEAMKLAEMMAGARLVPAGLQKSPADCLMLIQQAVRWQMDPFAVVLECSVIQGKLMYSGKLVAAVINTRGNLDERLSFAYGNEGADRTITVSGRLRGEQSPRTVTVALRDARTTNALWNKQPDQQLIYHGTRVWARRHMPEVMLGVYSPEEFEEAVTQGNRRLEAEPVNVTAVPVDQVVPTPEPPQDLPPHDPETGEIGPHAIVLPAATTPWRQYVAWGSQFIAGIGSAATLDELADWQARNEARLAEIEANAPKIHARIAANLEAVRNKLTPEAAAA